MRGRFITLEGIDGAGKSTQLESLAHLLRDRGVGVRVTREPGGTALGERVREILLTRERPLHPETETLLVFAARREHVAEVLLPSLQAGEWILCDRFTDATYAYQAGGSGVAWEKVEILERWAHPKLQPDLTVLLDLDPKVGRQRASAGRLADRFEREQEDYFMRVREAYLRRARSCPDRIRVVDAGKDADQVRESLEKVVLEALFRP